MSAIEINFGGLTGISHYMTFKSGSLKSCRLNEENRIETSVGVIIPQYSPAEFGERQKRDRRSLTFFESGAIKTVSLEQAMPLNTPLGVFKAEAVTFFEDGTLNRFFPLNGQIDGYWSEKNEGDLAEVLDFDLPVGKFSAKILCVNFYPSGALKSLTLWPGQKITINTPVGPMLIRTGFALYENGAVKSVEPAMPVSLHTPVGFVKAFDSEMLGMNADINSVQFTPEGVLSSLKTIHSGVKVINEQMEETVIEPVETESLIEMTQMRTVPMQFDFADDKITVIADQIYLFETDEYSFASFDRKLVIREACSACAGCSGGSSCCQS